MTMRYDLTANGRLERALMPEKSKIKRVRQELAPSSPLYLAGGALFALLALAGLLSGLLLPSPLGRLLAGGEPILRGSLLGVIVEVVRGSIPLPPVTWDGGPAGVLPLLLYGMSLLLALSVLLVLALAAFALCRTAQARRICFFNGGLTVLLYGILLLCGLLAGVTDLSVALTFSAAVLLLSLLFCVRRGGAGCLHALLLLCSLASWGAFVLPPLRTSLDALRLPPNREAVLLLVLFSVDAGNVLFSLFHPAKGGRLFDLVRFSAAAGAALAPAAVHLAENGPGLLTSYAGLLLLAPPLLGVLFSVLARILFPRKRTKKETGRAAGREPIEV